MAARTMARLIENSPARLAKPVERLGEIVNTESDVVQTGSTLRYEFGDGGIGAYRFQQFDAGRIWGRAGGKHGNAHLFYIYCFRAFDGHAENLPVKPQAFREAAHGNSQVIDFNAHAYSR